MHAIYSLVHHDGKEHSFDQNDVTIGRGKYNDLVLADSSVSRSHARILVREGRFWLRDEKSAGGVFVNGQRVSGQQEIQIGDVIQIGDSRVIRQCALLNLVYYLSTGFFNDDQC